MPFEFTEIERGLINSEGGVYFLYSSWYVKSIKVEFVRADLSFENSASECASMNGSMYPSFMIWRMVSLAFILFWENSFFSFSLSFTEICFYSNLDS